LRLTPAVRPLAEILNFLPLKVVLTRALPIGMPAIEMPYFVNTRIGSAAKLWLVEAINNGDAAKNRAVFLKLSLIEINDKDPGTFYKIT